MRMTLPVWHPRSINHLTGKLTRGDLYHLLERYRVGEFVGSFRHGTFDATCWVKLRRGEA